MAGRIAYYGNIVKDGLVFDLDAAKRDSYPGSGTVWSDISGFQNNGTLINGPTFNSANGGSIVFDGVDDYVRVPYSPTLDPTSAITFEAWCYPTDLTTIRYQELYRKEVSPGRHLFSFQEYGTILSFGTWTSLYNELYISGYKAIYANGTLLESNISITGSLVQGNAISYIGSNQGASEYFKGNYPLFRMYNKSLSQSEVLQNYNALKGRYGL